MSARHKAILATFGIASALILVKAYTDASRPAAPRRDALAWEQAPPATRAATEAAARTLDAALRAEIGATNHPWALALCIQALPPKYVESLAGDPFGKVLARFKQTATGRWRIGHLDSAPAEPFPNALLATLLAAGLPVDRPTVSGGPAAQADVTQLIDSALLDLAVPKRASDWQATSYGLEVLSFAQASPKTQSAERERQLSRLVLAALRQWRVDAQLFNARMGRPLTSELLDELRDAKQQHLGPYAQTDASLHFTRALYRGLGVLGDESLRQRARRFISTLLFRYHSERRLYGRGKPLELLRYAGEMQQTLYLAHWVTRETAAGIAGSPLAPVLQQLSTDVMSALPEDPSGELATARAQSTAEYLALLTAYSHALRGLRFALMTYR